MNILLAVIDAGLAGHTRSSLAIAHALRDRGHHICYLIGGTATAELIEAAGFPCERIATDWLGSYRPITRELPAILRRHGIDLVHSFSAEGLAEVVTVCKALQVPCFFTQCGGAGPSRMLPLNPMILFSEEVKDHLMLMHGFSPDSLKVIPARIDVARIDALRAGLAPELYPSFIVKYGLDPNARILLRIARMDPPYRTSILQGIDAVARLRRQGLPAQFVHIGYSDKGHAAWVYDEINRKIDAVNTEIGGSPVAVSAQDEAATALQYISMADVVIGVGRSAFEPMAFGKPTMVVGANGYAGMVTPEHAATLAYFNFSGRNVAAEQPYDLSVREIAGDLQRLLTDQDYFDELARFGRRYVEDVLDVRMAAANYELLYRDYPVQQYPDDRQLYNFARPLWKLLLHRVISHNCRSAILQRLKSIKKALHHGQKPASVTIS